MSPLMLLAAIPRTWWFLIFTGALCVFWLWLSSCYLRAFRRFRSWPSVSGRMISAGPEKVYRDWQECHVANVRYQYCVGAQVHEGRIVESVHLYAPPVEPVCFYKRGQAEHYISKLHCVGDVTVFYNPDDPSQAFLRHSSTAPLYIGCALVLLFLSIACLLARPGLIS